QSGSLKPEEAAQQWLKLLDRQFDLSAEDLPGGYQRSRQQFNPNDIWLALPPPAAWDTLRRAIDARPAQKGPKASREFALKLIAHTLIADRAAQTTDIGQLLTLAVKSDDENTSLIETVNELNQSLSEKSNDPDAIMKSVERRLMAND